ncbi:MAG: RDD family protein [Dermatophilaceae bacterium]
MSDQPPADPTAEDPAGPSTEPPAPWATPLTPGEDAPAGRPDPPWAAPQAPAAEDRTRAPAAQTPPPAPEPPPMPPDPPAFPAQGQYPYQAQGQDPYQAQPPSAAPAYPAQGQYPYQAQPTYPPPPPYPPQAGGYVPPPPQGYPPPPQGYPPAPQGYPPPSPVGGYAPAYAGPYQQPGVGPHGQPLASWGDRVIASLIDALYQLPFTALGFLGMILAIANAPTRTTRGVLVNPGNGGLVALGIVVMVMGFLGGLVIVVLNQIVAQGRTGQSWGKRRRGLRVLHQHTGAPLSMGMNFVRHLAHYLDSAVYIGYLWPLWDPMRRTFADMVMNTLVVKEQR